jgi:IclR family acetate operon transcriptional repressor
MAASDPSAQSSSVKSATRTLDIIEYVVAHNRPLVAQEIAVALGIPVSSLSYLLGTLVERGYLARDGRRYSAGPGLQRLQARSGGFSLAERAAPLVRTLRVQLNETTSFFIRSAWDVEAIVTETSEQALRYAVPTGARLPMHALASGQALLAALPDAELDRYFAETERQKFTPATVTSEKALRREIAGDLGEVEHLPVHVAEDPVAVGAGVGVVVEALEGGDRAAAVVVAARVGASGGGRVVVGRVGVRRGATCRPGGGPGGGLFFLFGGGRGGGRGGGWGGGGTAGGRIPTGAGRARRSMGRALRRMRGMRR